MHKDLSFRAGPGPVPGHLAPPRSHPGTPSLRSARRPPRAQASPRASTAPGTRRQGAEGRGACSSEPGGGGSRRDPTRLQKACALFLFSGETPAAAPCLVSPGPCPPARCLVSPGPSGGAPQGHRLSAPGMCGDVHTRLSVSNPEGGKVWPGSTSHPTHILPGLSLSGKPDLTLSSPHPTCSFHPHI